MKVLLAIFCVFTFLSLPQTSQAGLVHYTDPAFTPEYDFSDRDEGIYVFSLPILSTINWDHPGTALWSIIRNMFVAPKTTESSPTVYSSFGHMIVRFKCKDTHGKWHEDWGGMSGQNDSSIDKENLLKKKLGLKTLFQTYEDGEVESLVHNKHRIAKTLSVRHWTDFRRTNYMYFPINSRQCEAVSDYFYQFRKRSYDHNVPVREWAKRDPRDHLHFGFSIDSYKSYREFKSGKKDYRLGGGCTSFAVGALKVAGVFDPYFEGAWSRELNIPERLIGDVDAETGVQKKVSILPLMAGTETFAGWTDRKEGRRHLRFYDPEKVWNFIHSAQRCLNSGRCTPEVQGWLDSHQGKNSAPIQLPTRYVGIQKIVNSQNYSEQQFRRSYKNTLNGVELRANVRGSF